ncbi:hypothetical protein BS47DRAFT_1401048 [Hydnum rufescens UP504]|uniref:Uncharacterized protein n=1 Tax=Hydnum rufescens UP504 TaxID=1448309 RepID=A0A9P6DN42_9AGAM|nr:hypothetical protein BS47DRAFT_1401048 [Hydnum rufescens UP504]
MSDAVPSQSGGWYSFDTAKRAVRHNLSRHVNPAPWRPCYGPKYRCTEGTNVHQGRLSMSERSDDVGTQDMASEGARRTRVQTPACGSVKVRRWYILEGEASPKSLPRFVEASKLAGGTPSIVQECTLLDRTKDNVMEPIQSDPNSPNGQTRSPQRPSVSTESPYNATVQATTTILNTGWSEKSTI